MPNDTFVPSGTVFPQLSVQFAVIAEIPLWGIVRGFAVTLTSALDSSTVTSSESYA